MSSINQSRRRFLRNAAAAGVTGAALSPWLQMQAMAQAAQGSDYKALICLFMFGGNDGNNLLVPYEQAAYDNYARIRGGLALPQAGLLPLAPSNTGGVRYALHPAFTRLQALFGTGQAAMLANIGTLITPTTKAQWQARSVPLPSNLFSHSDQQSEWQTDILDAPGRSGWGGRLLETVVDDALPTRGYSCVSVSGNTLWVTGTHATAPAPYRVPPSGNFGFNFYHPNSTTPDALTTAIKSLLTSQRSDPFHSTWLKAVNRSVDNQSVLDGVLKSQTVPVDIPNSDLGRQLGMIYKLIQSRTALSQTRQCFFCSIGGFDTHSDEISSHQNLYAEIDAAVGGFYKALNDAGLADKVTLFTASDFGRTFTPNGSGTDHGWGSHHFVVGGGVNGGRIVGKFPAHVIGGDDDVGGGNWLPTTSIDQLGRELGRWFGVSSTDLASVFPRLANFNDDLALMKA